MAGKCTGASCPLWLTSSPGRGWTFSSCGVGDIEKADMTTAQCITPPTIRPAVLERTTASLSRSATPQAHSKPQPTKEANT